MPVRKDENGAGIDNKRKLKLLLDTIYLAFSSLSGEIEGVSKIITLLIQEYFAMNDKETQELHESTPVQESPIISEKSEPTNTETTDSSMQSMMISIMRKLDEQNKKLDEQTKIIEAQTKQIEQLNNRLAAQEKEFNEKLKVQEKESSERFKAQEKEIKSLNEIIYNQNVTISELRQESTNQKLEISSLRTENMQLKEKIASLELLNSKEEQEDFLENLSIEELDESAKGQSWNPGNGFLDTVSYFFPCRSQKREIEELKKAASEGNLSYLLEILNRPINKNIDVNGRGMPDSICSLVDGSKDNTALILAAKNGHLNCVNILLRNGAEVNFVNRDEKTALDYAKRSQDSNMIEHLKRVGARTGRDVLVSLGYTNDNDDEVVLMNKLHFKTI